MSGGKTLPRRNTDKANSFIASGKGLISDSTNDKSPTYLDSPLRKQINEKIRQKLQKSKPKLNLEKMKTFGAKVKPLKLISDKK